MSSNAALSAARRRRSNPAPTTNMQPPPTNRILQRTGVPPPPHAQQPPFNPRMSTPQQQQSQMHGGGHKPQGRGQVPPQQQQSRQQPQHMLRPQSPGLPPLPPPVKTAGPLYGIPIHPLVMFKTHDNKLSEHELSIGDCIEQLKEIDERLAAVESFNGNSGGDKGEVEMTGGGGGGVGDLNELINDEAFINGIVDNIMNTTNLSSIVENVIPLKEENEALKEQVEGLNEKVEGLNKQVEGLHGKLEEWKERMQHLEDLVRSICSDASAVAHVSNATATTEEVVQVPSDEKCMDQEEGECKE